MRQNLAVKHAESVKQSEKQMRILQQERQAVFQDAFQNDLKYYKEVGKIPSNFYFHLSLLRGALIFIKKNIWFISRD